MNSRDAILARVRRNLAESGVQPEPAPPIPLRTHDQSDGKSLVDLFSEQLELVAGVCHRVSSVEGAAEALRAIVADHHAVRLARTDDPMVIDLLERVVGTFEILPPESDREQLLQCDIGVSAARFGIAQHGTIVLPSGQADLDGERTRLVALLPKVHVAIIRASDLLGTVAEVLARLPELGDEDRPLPPTVTFATGPSRTADIEQKLVLGVHGPHAQHVILLEHT